MSIAIRREAERQGPLVVDTRGREVHRADSFDDFFRAAYPVLWRIGMARTGDRSTAEDLAQDVLGDVHRRWSHVRELEDPLGWARRAMLNRSISWWRRRDSERRALTRVTGQRATDAAALPELADEELWSAIRSLPRRQFEVVVLRWFEDLATSEVAEVLGCSTETVRTHWRRAAVALADRLGEPRGDLDVG